MMAKKFSFPRRSRSLAFALAGTAVCLLPFTSALSAQADTPSPSKGPVPAVDPSAGTQPPNGALPGGTSLPAGGAIPACAIQAAGDNFHISSSPPTAASAHGWWTTINCQGNASVRIGAYEFYSDGTYHYKGYNTGNPLPGGGSTSRVPLRLDCDGFQPVTWYSVVEVTRPDAPFSTVTTPKQTFNCAVSK